MQAEQLQGVREELLAVRESLRPLQKKQREEVLKDEPNKALLDQLEGAIAPLAATMQKLRDEHRMLETQPKGKQWAQRLMHGQPCVEPDPGSWGQRTDCHLSSQAVAVAAVVHLLDMTAPAEARVLRATGYLRAQAACTGLHAAHHALQKAIVDAAM